MPSQLTPQQIALMVLLTEQGHIRPSLLSLIRGGVTIGPIPIIRVTPGFLGMPGGYTFGWASIGVFLDGVQEVFFLIMDGFLGGGEGGEGERESVGGGPVAGGGEVGEGLIEGGGEVATEGGEGVDDGGADSDSSMYT